MGSREYIMNPSSPEEAIVGIIGCIVLVILGKIFLEGRTG